MTLERSAHTEEGIYQAFPTYGGWRTMPGIDSNIVAKWKDLIDDTLDELMVVPSWEVRSPDGTGEERIPGEDSTRRRKAHPSRRVAGCVDSPNGVGAYLYYISFTEITVCRKPKTRRIQGMNEYRRLCDSLEFRCSPYMINMSVCDKDVENSQSVPGYLIYNSDSLITGVNDHPHLGLVASQDVTVGLVGPYDQFSQHGLCDSRDFFTLII